MNDYEKTIEVLQNRVRALEQLIQPVNAVAEPVKWQPKGGYFQIDGEGDVVSVNSFSHKKEFGTKRITREQALRAAVEMRRFNRLLALRDELCEDDEADREDIDFRKYYLFFNRDNGKWISTYDNTCYETITHYFTTKEAAQKACDMLNSGEVEL